MYVLCIMYVSDVCICVCMCACVIVLFWYQIILVLAFTIIFRSTVGIPKVLFLDFSLVLVLVLFN